MDPAQVSKTEVFQRLIPDAGTSLCLILIFGVICWALFRLRSFWRDDADRDAMPHEMLTQFRESQREGVLSAEEYRLIKGRLTQRAQPVSETERHESAAKPTESAKGIAASPFVNANREESNTKPDQPR